MEGSSDSLQGLIMGVRGGRGGLSYHFFFKRFGDCRFYFYCYERDLSLFLCVIFSNFFLIYFGFFYQSGILDIYFDALLMFLILHQI